MDFEKAEEEEKARKCFNFLASKEGGVSMINVSDMEKWITSLGIVKVEIVGSGMFVRFATLET